MKHRKIIMGIIARILVSVIVIGIIIQVGKIGGQLADFLPWKKEREFQLDTFMEARGYQLDTYKWVDFTQDGVVDIVATGVREKDEQQEWKLFLINGENYKIVDSDEGRVWPEGHNLEVEWIKDAYHMIYNHTHDYGESKIYKIVEGKHLKSATLSGDHYYVEKVKENQVRVIFEDQKYEQLFDITEGKYKGKPKAYYYLTRGTSYYFEGEYLVNMQYISFPEIYDTAGFGINTYYEWRNEEWILAKVAYSNGPEFTMVQ